MLGWKEIVAVVCCCRRLFAAVLVVWLTAAAAASAQGIGDIDEYRLGPGDRLDITVFGHPDVSGEFEVGGSGQVTLPLLGQVAAAGLTVTELTDRIAAALDRDYLVNPRVTIEVLNYRPFYILGEINSPGSYPYISGLSIRQAVAIAGGFTRRARESPVVVIRDTENGRETVEVNLDAPVLPGDTIEIERRLF
jgi:polysaccharide export outer membrane protein